MRYEKHTTEFDNVVRIEELTESEVEYMRFQKKIHGMYCDAVEEISAMTAAAKKALQPKTIVRRGLFGYPERYFNVNSFSGPGFEQALSRQQMMARQGQGNSLASILGGLTGFFPR